MSQTRIANSILQRWWTVPANSWMPPLLKHPHLQSRLRSRKRRPGSRRGGGETTRRRGERAIPAMPTFGRAKNAGRRVVLFVVVAVRAVFEPLRVVRLAQNTKPRMNVVSRYGAQKTA